jgi:hypothetical protein
MSINAPMRFAEWRRNTEISSLERSMKGGSVASACNSGATGVS